MLHAAEILLSGVIQQVRNRAENANMQLSEAVFSSAGNFAPVNEME